VFAKEVLFAVEFDEPAAARPGWGIPGGMVFSCRKTTNSELKFGIFAERCIKGASKLKKPCFPGENRRLDVVMGEIDR
jgi:hypothetical protein